MHNLNLVKIIYFYSFYVSPKLIIFKPIYDFFIIFNKLMKSSIIEKTYIIFISIVISISIIFNYI